MSHETQAKMISKKWKKNIGFRERRWLKTHLYYNNKNKYYSNSSDFSHLYTNYPYIYNYLLCIYVLKLGYS